MSFPTLFRMELRQRIKGLKPDLTYGERENGSHNEFGWSSFAFEREGDRDSDDDSRGGRPSASQTTASTDRRRRVKPNQVPPLLSPTLPKEFLVHNGESDRRPVAGLDNDLAAELRELLHTDLRKQTDKRIHALSIKYGKSQS